jgi:hypothetical protein
MIAAGDEQLAAIGDLVSGLRAATASYGNRPLDWDDLAPLRRVHEQLGTVVKAFRCAAAAAERNGAARRVATELRIRE